MTKFKRLQEVTGIFSGFTLRDITYTAEGSIMVVQPKDIDQATNRLVYTDVLRIDIPDAAKKHYLRAGDILISSKGKTTPVVKFEEKSFKVVASAAFIVVRPNEKYVDADYIAWYLQLPLSQKFFDSSKAGSTVLNLSIKTVQNLVVHLPSKLKQTSIGKVYNTLLKKNAKQLELMEKYKALLNHSMYEEIIK